jgi:hypothetical protein
MDNEKEQNNEDEDISESDNQSTLKDSTIKKSQPPVTVVQQQALTRIMDFSGNIVTKLKKLHDDLHVILSVSGKDHVSSMTLEQAFCAGIITDTGVSLKQCDPVFTNKVKERNLTTWQELYLMDTVELLTHF